MANLHKTHAILEPTGDGSESIEQFLADLAVVRAPNTIRAYRQDLLRWQEFCKSEGLSVFEIKPRNVIAFVRAERKRAIGGGKTVGPRTLVRRLAAIRQWYDYLMLEPELTGIRRNPVPSGSSLRAAVGAVSAEPALLRYDQAQPDTLTAEEMDRFIAQLTSTTHRDRAIVFLLKDGAVRISEALDLRMSDIHWAGHHVTIRATKTRNSRIVPLSADALNALGNYIRLERPKQLDHDYVFVCLGRRSFGRPFRYRAWVYICEQARRGADAPRVHAHAMRHTCATNLAEAGMPIDTLKRQLGHRRIETTMIYNHVRDSRLHKEYRDAMAVMADSRTPHTDDGEANS